MKSFHLNLAWVKSVSIGINYNILDDSKADYNAEKSPFIGTNHKTMSEPPCPVTPTRDSLLVKKTPTSFIYSGRDLLNFVTFYT